MTIRLLIHLISREIGQSLNIVLSVPAPGWVALPVSLSGEADSPVLRYSPGPVAAPLGDTMPPLCAGVQTT